ncbi:MAG TPA: hypothetical protein VLV89_13855, partial [Candidatus Acidoferrum sp.]|nr:hypothetical protein [Candidatus Acidoferrum sp.]
TSRPLRLKYIFEHVSETYGDDVARALMIDNPRAAFEGLPLPHVPDVHEEEIINGPAPHKKRRPWFFGSRR